MSKPRAAKAKTRKAPAPRRAPEIFQTLEGEGARSDSKELMLNAAALPYAGSRLESERRSDRIVVWTLFEGTKVISRWRERDAPGLAKWLHYALLHRTGASHVARKKLQEIETNRRNAPKKGELPRGAPRRPERALLERAMRATLHSRGEPDADQINDWAKDYGYSPTWTRAILAELQRKK